MIEKLTRLLKHSSIYTIATILQKLTGVVLLALLTDTTLVSTDENSAYNFFISTTVIFANLFSLGMEASIVRFLKIEPENKSKILASATNLIVISLMVGLAICAFFTDFLATYAIRDIRFGEMVIFIGIVAAFDMLANIPQFYFRASERPTIFTLLKVLRFIFEIGFIYAGLHYLDVGIMGAVYGLTAATVFNFIILIPFFKRFYTLSWDSAYFKTMLAFGLPLVPNAVLYLFIEIEDRYFLDNFIDKATQTAYTNMYKFAAILTVINSAFRAAFQPLMLNEAKADNREYFRKVMTYFLVLSSVIMVFASLLAVDFIRYNPFDFIRALIQDEFYYTQTHLLALILLGYLFLGMYYNLSVSYYFKKKSHIFVQFTFFGLVVNFALNLLMIPYPEYGTLISASATAAAYAVMAGFSYLRSRSLFKIEYDFAAVGLIFLYVAGVTYVAVFQPDTSIRIKLLIAVAYLPYLLLCRVVKLSDLRTILRLGKQ